MKQTVNFTLFEQAFIGLDRHEQFGGYDGLRALFDYLEAREFTNGEEMELDVIELCGDYAHYESIDELNRDCNEEFETLEEIEKYTTVIRIDDSDAFIIASF